MIRHFLSLYLLIVVALAAVSVSEEYLSRAYGRLSAEETAQENRAQAAVLSVLEQQLATRPHAEREAFVANLARESGVDLDLFDEGDIAGSDTLERLRRGELAFMSASDGRSWLLKRVADDGDIIAVRYAPPDTRRGPLEWVLAFIFYGAIALVLMIWLWPLSRDLRALERATASFGNRNWRYEANIEPNSQIHPLAMTFRRMAARIDGLIGSHKDMSNAIAHEIRTPLARMRFEVEAARTATDSDQLATRLANINTDIAELDAFVTATLDYAILERAEVALNLSDHDFTLILPAVTDSVQRTVRSKLTFDCEVESHAARVRCDAHLMETVLRNLLYNATRYARTRIRVQFRTQGANYQLSVDDDGPGIPTTERERVFDSFVQLREPGTTKSGFGLGLAIVKRIGEWHGGSVSAGESELGGASFVVRWPS